MTNGICRLIAVIITITIMNVIFGEKNEPSFNYEYYNNNYTPFDGHHRRANDMPW